MKIAAMPISKCGSMWQWKSQTPGLLARKRMTTHLQRYYANSSSSGQARGNMRLRVRLSLQARERPQGDSVSRRRVDGVVARASDGRVVRLVVALRNHPEVMAVQMERVLLGSAVERVRVVPANNTSLTSKQATLPSTPALRLGSMSVVYPFTSATSTTSPALRTYRFGCCGTAPMPRKYACCKAGPAR